MNSNESETKFHILHFSSKIPQLDKESLRQGDQDNEQKQRF